MSSIYDDLGPKFDSMIQWRSRLEKEAPFLQRLFSENRITRVLDLGCGTGHHVRLFHNWGCEVVGFDGSAALLEMAREHNGHDAEGVEFIHGQFTELQDKVKGPFDAVLSLGNSLPHMQSEEELKTLLGAVWSELREGGVFVFQNRNYDRLLKTRERFHFPTTYRSADVEQMYFRFNDFLSEDRVRFNIVHFKRVNEAGNWIHDVYSTELTPWKRDQVNEHLLGAGFSRIDFYGDFSGTPFDADTAVDLVGLARKPQAPKEEG